MKKIILKSKLSEDDALSKLGKVSKDLLDKGLISKGDELVAGVEEKDGGTLITINADLMTKDNYKNIKAKFLEVGEVLENDLKNFDEETPENTPKDPKDTKEPKNEDTHGEQKAVDQNSVKTAEAVLHDTNELLFDINPNQKDMDDLKTLLFSEEEINKAPESEEKRPADPAAEEKKPEAKEHDDDAEGKDKKEPETPKDPDEKKEVELHDLLFSDEELITFDSLLFSDEELIEHDDENDKKEPEAKEHDDDKDKKECPFHDREEALKALAQYRQKAAEGKELTVAEKYFCDMAGKHFSEDEVKEAQSKLAPKAPEAPKDKPEVKEHDDAKKFKVLCPEGKTIKDGFESEEAAKKYIEENKIAGATVAEMKEHDDKPKEDPKKEPEAPKADPKPEEKKEEPKEESKMELIRRLNRENSENTLLGRAKEVLKRDK